VYTGGLLGVHKVVTFLGWMCWLLNVGLAGKEFVTLNMDETNLSQVHTMKKGTVPNKLVIRHEKIRAAPIAVDRAHSRTTLMAAVCNDPTLQPHLPQVILPRYSKEASPPKHLLDEYEKKGISVGVLAQHNWECDTWCNESVVDQAALSCTLAPANCMACGGCGLCDVPSRAQCTHACSPPWYRLGVGSKSFDLDAAIVGRVCVRPS
jgi:hypothetical protein